MTKHFLAGAALLLSVTTAGLAITAAAGESGFLTAQRHVRIAASETLGQGEPTILFARESRKHGHHAERLAKRDRHHDDDDDDDDDEDGGQGMVPQSGPANPTAPVPDNGLFNGNSRPKVQIQ